MDLQLYTPTLYRPWRDENFAVACSGGADSMAALAFFVKGGYKPTVLHVNHNTGNHAAHILVEQFADANGLVFRSKFLDKAKPKGESWEEYWRNGRLEFFHEFNGSVITGHNLDDAMETWVFSSMHGQPKIIPHQNINVFRPFLLNRKKDMYAYVRKHEIKWEEDASNVDITFARNYIRHHLIPDIESNINKGLDKVIKKKYLGR